METLTINGNEYALGCLPRTIPVGGLRLTSERFIEPLEASIPLMPESQWEPTDFSHLLPEIGLQGSHGSCVGHQCTDALMGVRAQTGQPLVKLSPWDLYRRICGGRDQGAQISDGVRELHDNGVCKIELCPSYTPSPRSTDGMKKDEAFHRLDESFDAPNRQAIATAMCKGFFTPLGIEVAGNFERLEQIEGYVCVPKPAGGIRGGHCVCACGMRKIGDIWRVLLATKSWGLDFGTQGCVWYALDWIDDRFADAWPFRSTTICDT